MVCLALALIAGPPQDAARPYLEAARKAAAWVESREPAPRDDASLYSGSSGELIFFCELAATEPSSDARAAVDRRARAVFAGSPNVEEMGLYTGLAGIAFALECAHLATGAREHREAALAVMERIAKAARTVGEGAEWNDTTDIIAGTAGIGCTLLWGSTALQRPDLTDLARRAGDRLIELAKPQGEGLSWSMAKADEPRSMPNFSHGTAGVAYFLSQLGRATGERRYADAAKKGAAYLMAQTGPTGLIHHHEPGGSDLFYLGWCHGPPGTARLFASLHAATGERAAGEWIDTAARTLSASGIPDQRAPGYWNNYGLCCGDAGVLRFFLDLYRLDKRPDQLEFARRLGRFLLDRGEREKDGLKWTFAENRVSPDEVRAQAGLMQGAAGIGLALLWLDGVERSRPALVRLPDAPWRW